MNESKFPDSAGKSPDGASPKSASWDKRLAEARERKAELIAKRAGITGLRETDRETVTSATDIVAMGAVDTLSIDPKSDPPTWMTDALPLTEQAPVEEPVVLAPAKPRRNRWLDRTAAIFTIGALGALYLTGQFGPVHPQIAAFLPAGGGTPVASAPVAAPAAAPAAESPAATAEADTVLAATAPAAELPAASPQAAPAETAAVPPQPAEDTAGEQVAALDTTAGLTPDPDSVVAPTGSIGAATPTLPTIGDTTAAATPRRNVRLFSAPVAVPEPTAPGATTPGAGVPEPRIASLSPGTVVPRPRPTDVGPWQPRGISLAATRDFRIIFTSSNDMTAAQRAGYVSAIEEFGFNIGTSRSAGFTISENQVRFFHEEDITAAGAVADAIGARVRNFTTYRPAPPPGTIEVFLNAEAGAPPLPETAQDAASRLRDRLATSLQRGDHL